MNWLARLKTGTNPEAHATKPTKPIPDPQNRGFVGSVASIPEFLPKTTAPAEAANDPAPNLRKPEPAPSRITLAPAPTPALTAYDPGEAALLALAMAHCTYTGASDKARQDWRQDIANTPPELRGDLYQHLREQLRDQRLPAPAPAPPAPASKQPAPGWLHMDQPWRAADRAYLAHHGQCPACKAAATGHSERCATGQHLHDTYLAALATT